MVIALSDTGGWIRATILWTLLLIVPGIGAAAQENREVALGREIAVDACSACHRVTSLQPNPAAVLDADSGEKIFAPNFLEISKSHGNDIAFLYKSIAHPKYPMREQMWNDADLSALVAYIKSLRGTHGSWQ